MIGYLTFGITDVRLNDALLNNNGLFLYNQFRGCNIYSHQCILRLRFLLINMFEKVSSDSFVCRRVPGSVRRGARAAAAGPDVAAAAGALSRSGPGALGSSAVAATSSAGHAETRSRGPLLPADGRRRQHSQAARGHAQIDRRLIRKDYLSLLDPISLCECSIRPGRRPMTIKMTVRSTLGVKTVSSCHVAL